VASTRTLQTEQSSIWLTEEATRRYALFFAVDTYREGPSAPPTSPHSPSEPEVVHGTTDGAGEQGEAQGAARAWHAGDFASLAMGLTDDERAAFLAAANPSPAVDADKLQAEIWPADPPWLEEAIEAAAVRWCRSVTTTSPITSSTHRCTDKPNCSPPCSCSGMPWPSRRFRPPSAPPCPSSHGVCVGRNCKRSRGRYLLRHGHTPRSGRRRTRRGIGVYAAGMEAAAHTVANSIDRERAARAGGGE